MIEIRGPRRSLMGIAMFDKQGWLDTCNVERNSERLLSYGHYNAAAQEKLKQVVQRRHPLRLQIVFPPGIDERG